MSIQFQWGNYSQYFLTEAKTVYMDSNDYDTNVQMIQVPSGEQNTF